MAKNKKDVRARTWTFILYPESAPENWRYILDGYHIPWVESPLHDKDVNPDGTVKKAHRHIILLFDGKKSFEQVKDITDALNAPIPQKTANTKGLVRYLIHMDNPEKQAFCPGHAGFFPRRICYGRNAYPYHSHLSRSHKNGTP